MDLKLRFQNNNQQNIFMPNKSQEVFNDPLNRYARKTNKKLHEKVEETTDIQDLGNKTLKRFSNNLNNKSLNHYRIDSNAKANPNQFRRYICNTQNIFYENRPELIQLNYIKMTQRISGCSLCMLFFISFILYFIQPFPLECPSNATCGVYPHCYEGYQYDQERNMCQVSEQLIQKSEQLAILVIQRLQYEYGSQQCSSEPNLEAPSASLNQFLQDIQDFTIKRQVNRKLILFVTDEKQQQQRGFVYIPQQKLIIPTKKSYTFQCYTKLFLNNQGSILKIIITLLCITLPIFIVKYIIRFFKARIFYNKLREQTLKQKRINISYAKQDLENKHGQIDQGLWAMIDQCRKKGREIVYVQDDFLYWQAL